MGLFPFMISFLRLHRNKREERREGGKTRQKAESIVKMSKGHFMARIG